MGPDPPYVMIQVYSTGDRPFLRGWKVLLVDTLRPGLPRGGDWKVVGDPRDEETKGCFFFWLRFTKNKRLRDSKMKDVLLQQNPV